MFKEMRKRGKGPCYLQSQAPSARHVPGRPLGETWARLFLFLWQESDLGFDSRVTVPTRPKGTPV